VSGQYGYNTHYSHRAIDSSTFLPWLNSSYKGCPPYFGTGFSLYMLSVWPWRWKQHIPWNMYLITQCLIPDNSNIHSLQVSHCLFQLLCFIVDWMAYTEKNVGAAQIVVDINALQQSSYNNHAYYSAANIFSLHGTLTLKTCCLCYMQYTFSLSRSYVEVPN
jgi:hypothetical protein